MILTCRSCGQNSVLEQLNFGSQALRNRFLLTADEEEYKFALGIGCCNACGMVQLAEPPPVHELRPRFNWISYNEPERHLDELTTVLATLPGISPQSKFAGLTYKDDSTLARLKRSGFVNVWRPDLATDLRIEAPNSGIESVQARLNTAEARTLITRFGQPDVLIARHILEHTHNTPAALNWAYDLVKPDGYVVFEVPDAVRALERRDYTTVWEEHVLYFTPHTLNNCLRIAGFEVVHLESYPYTLENSLVIIARPSLRKRAPTGISPVNEIERASAFFKDYTRTTQQIQRQLCNRGRIAMLGAGHLTGAFVNLYGLADRIEFVADDNPHKQGLFMPGSRLPIRPTSELLASEIECCLMTVRPEIEANVVSNNAAFTASGGVMASVFPDSPYSLERSMVRERMKA